ncbi:hypothetical protein MFIFM68171_10106 [Madurella fahalii]|uniref:Uncharacterized protein n=1 Tax=Madurella fahalii TaxID=1157608 RepID=A0ABQ0GQ75_9PEZI
MASSSEEVPDWLGNPWDSVGYWFGRRGRAEHDEDIWTVLTGSPTHRAIQSLMPDIKSALRDAFLTSDYRPLPECRIFMVGEPSSSTPTILVNVPEDLNPVYRWKVATGLRERQVFTRFPGLDFGVYWPNPTRRLDARIPGAHDSGGKPQDIRQLAPPPMLPSPLEPLSFPSQDIAGNEQPRRHSNTPTAMLSTVPDSGYGTSSNAATSAKVYQLSPGQDGEIDVSDIASVVTDNLSLDLPNGLTVPPNPQLVDALPDLLRAFALRLAYTEKLPEGKAVSTFTRQNKHRIAEAFYGLWEESLDEPLDARYTYDEGRLSDRSMTFQQKIELWPDFDPSASQNHSGEEIPINEQFQKDHGALLDVFPPDVDEHTGLHEAFCDDAGLGDASDADDLEGKPDMPVLSEVDISRINFVINTPSFALLRATVQRIQDHHSLATALTITGSGRRTQLLTCREYLKQTWPQVGEQVLKVLIAAVVREGEAAEGHLFDDTRILVAMGDGVTRVDCTGLQDSIVEVTEVVSWIGAALRESTFSPDEISSSIANLHVLQGSSQDGGVRCLVTFIEEEIAQDEMLPGRGACWYGLLKNPVVAQGFPVPMRANDLRGLEIPLEAMGLLVGAPRLTVFQEVAVLKGFNAATVATACTTDKTNKTIMLWHFMMNPDGSRLPFSDHRVSSGGISFSLLAPAAVIQKVQAARHILGWAPKVSYNIGSPLANYDIGWSSPDFCWARLCPGKDKSPMIRRDTAYFDTLIALTGSYVVLYDVQDHRAWLSNGLHTLLHLVRASLKHDCDSELAPECLFDPSELEEGLNVCSPRAAIDFLRNRHNLERPVFPDLDDVRTEQATIGGQTSKTEYRTSTGVLLKDRVNQIMYVFEQLIDYQASLDPFLAGLPFKLRPRGKLEGYRFTDIAARRSVTPRVAHLGMSSGCGKSWVDFTRAIKAVTLFGEGFGELISPVQGDTDAAKTCPGLEMLPRWKEYLAVSTYDLSRIVRQEGSASSVPMKLAPGVYWHAASVLEAFDCKVKASNQGRDGRNPPVRRHCDHIQVVLPHKTLMRQLCRSPFPESQTSASRSTGNPFGSLGNEVTVKARWKTAWWCCFNLTFAGIWPVVIMGDGFHTSHNNPNFFQR